MSWKPPRGSPPPGPPQARPSRARWPDARARVRAALGQASAPGPLLLGVAVGVLAAVDLPAAVVIVALLGVVVAVLTAADVRAVLHVMVLSTFVEGLSVGHLSIGRLVAVAGVLALVLRMIVSSWRPPSILPASWVPVVLFVCWAWTSGLWATHTTAWMYAMGQLALAAGFFVVFALFVTGPADVRSLLRTYVVGASVAAVVGVVQVATSDTGRAVGMQGDGNIYAVYQLAAIPAAVALARAGAARGPSRRWLLVLPLLVASIIASQSRGALVAGALVVLVLWVQFERSRVTPGGLLPRLALVLALAATGAVAVSVNARLSPQRIAQDRASGRLDLWYVAWQAAREHLAQGIGAGNFKPHSVELLTTTPGVQLVKSHLLLLTEGIEVHNVYLEALTEQGVPGFVLLIVLLASIVLALRRSVQRHGALPELTALTPMLVAYLGSAIFLSIINSKLLWMIAGLSAALQVARPGRPAMPSPVPTEGGTRAVGA